MSSPSEWISALGGGAVLITAAGKTVLYLVALYKERKAVGDAERKADKKAEDSSSRGIVKVLSDQLEQAQKRGEEQIKRSDERADRELAVRENLTKTLIDVGQGMKDLGRTAIEHSTTDRADHARILAEVTDLKNKVIELHRAVELSLARSESPPRRPLADGASPLSPNGTAP